MVSLSLYHILSLDHDRHARSHPSLHLSRLSQHGLWSGAAAAPRRGARALCRGDGEGWGKGSWMEIRIKSMDFHSFLNLLFFCWIFLKLLVLE